MILTIALCVVSVSFGFIGGLYRASGRYFAHLDRDNERFKPVDAEKIGGAILNRGCKLLTQDERAVYELTRPDGKKKRFIEGIGG